MRFEICYCILVFVEWIFYFCFFLCCCYEKRELRDPEDELICILQCNKTYFGGGVFWLLRRRCCSWWVCGVCFECFIEVYIAYLSTYEPT